jgi:hypothetical protein
MAKVLKCLDQGCTQLILVETDDGTERIIHQPKEKCDYKHAPKDHKLLMDEWNRITLRAHKTVYTSETLFKNVKIGDELKL